MSSQDMLYDCKADYEVGGCHNWIQESVNV